ncbi:hypothetical protein VP01_603g1, partial [Puccinia sorghi]
MKLFLALTCAVGLFLAEAPALTSATCFAARDVGSNIKDLKSGPLNRRSCFEIIKKKKKYDDYDEDEGKRATTGKRATMARRAITAAGTAATTAATPAAPTPMATARET